jgi:hypothetical protein
MRDIDHHIANGFTGFDGFVRLNHLVQAELGAYAVNQMLVF